ncbi:MAG: LicD family protein [Alistipes sp.]|nr:LicD family protein [Alistipes sp.]
MKLLSTREVQLLQLELMKEVDTFCANNNIQYYFIGGSCLGAVRHNGFIPWDDDIDIAMMREDYEKFLLLSKEHFNNKKYFVQNYMSDPYLIPALTRLCIKNTYVDIKSERHHKNCKNTYIDVFPLDNVPDEDTLMHIQRNKLYKIDRLIQLKQFHLYRDSKVEYIVKKIVSIILGIIPLSLLKKRRVEVMSEYKNTKTSRVCSTTSRYGYNKQVMPKEIYGTPVRHTFEDYSFYIPEKYDEYLKHLFGESYMEIPPVHSRVAPQSIYIDDEYYKTIKSDN